MLRKDGASIFVVGVLPKNKFRFFDFKGRAIARLSSLGELDDSQLAGARVGAVVDLGELGGGELGVALGCGEAFVAEQFLNGAQVRAFLQ